MSKISSNAAVALATPVADNPEIANVSVFKNSIAAIVCGFCSSLTVPIDKLPL